MEILTEGLEDLKVVISNSKESYKAINEGTSEADIASYETILGRLIQEKSVSSLAYQICEVQPLTASSGAIFVAKESASTPGQIEIVKQSTTLIKKNINTGLTKETHDDINSMFKGERANSIISNLLKNLSDDEENTELISKLDSIAVNSTGITLSAPGNSETTLFEVSKKVAELVLQINSKKYKTLQGFAILPRKLAAAFLAMGIFNESTTNGLLIGQHGKIKYFVNPDSTVTKTFVGVVDKTRIGNSSLVFSPYQYTLVKTTAYDTGNLKMNLIDRFSITENPFSVSGDSMIYEFTAV